MRRRLTFEILLATGALAMVACAPGSKGSGDDEGEGAGGAGGAGADAGSDGQGGSGGDFDDDPEGQCEEKAACGDGGICAGGVCCDAELACGSQCCSGGTICSFQKCVAPGATCVDKADCAEGQYCEYALGEPGEGGHPDGGAPACQGGVVLATGKCLPKPPSCGEGNDPGEPMSCLPSCEYRPPVAAFEPELKYAWGDPSATNTKDSVMMAPIVIQLDDDNCDGLIDERDIPEIVFTTFESGMYSNDGTLHAISVEGGVLVEKWAVKSPVGQGQIHPGVSIAGGNIDGLPGNEIVVCLTDGRARAYTASGQVLWTSEGGGCSMPSIADLDQDGQPEVITEARIIDGSTGTTKHAFSGSIGNFVVYDLDGDGFLDIVTGNRVYRNDGSLAHQAAVPAGYVAVGDFDDDGRPEVVSIETATHSFSIWHLVPDDDPNAAPGTLEVEVVRQGVDINGDAWPGNCSAASAGYTRGGGPPTVADFNGDGFPDVALAGGVAYAVFDGKKLMDSSISKEATILWAKKTQDCSSAATGSSVFDFEGDGKAEVIYGDELTLRIYDGVTGEVVWSTCNTSGTLLEYPLVADVDNDGQADIVVASNSYSGFNCGGVKTAGIRVFGDKNGNWVRTRRVWNQHAYHVTNVNEDGSIPTIEKPNHKQPRLNNFRQNVQPLGEFSAPDLVVSVFPKCSGEYGIVARVRNIGEAAAPAGIPIDFYLDGPPGTGTLIAGSPLTTSKALYPAESEDVVLPWPSAPADVRNGTTKLYAVVDDGGVHTWRECRVDNNVSAAASGYCSGVK